MGISFLVAIGNESVMGNQGKLPWHLPDDLQYFKKLTIGHKMIMGRKTFQSLPGILEGRFHLVLSTQNLQVRSPMVKFFKTKEEILKAINPTEEVFVIGGAETFQLFADVASKIYVTKILADFNGDTFFPETILYDGQWKLISTIQGMKTDENPYRHYFQVHERPGFRYDI